MKNKSAAMNESDDIPSIREIRIELKELQNQRKRRQTQEQKLVEIELAIGNAQSQVAQLAASIARRVRRIDELREHIRAEIAKIDALKQDLDDADECLSGRRELLSTEISVLDNLPDSKPLIAEVQRTYGNEPNGLLAKKG